MKYLIVCALLTLLLAACTPETVDNSPSPTANVSDQKTDLTVELETPQATAVDDQEESSEPTEAVEEVEESESLRPALGRPVAGEALELKPTEEAQTKTESEMQQHEEEGTEVVEIVAPSGSVDLGELPPTPSGETEPGELVIKPAPGSPDPTSKLVDQAKDDLSERIDINAEEIEVLSVENVNWPDGSLGCPERGMMYIQAITPGYLIILEVEAEEYEYHTDIRSQVKLCQDGHLDD